MSISYYADKRQFTLTGQNFSYSFHVTDEAYLNHLYYGAKLSEGADLTYRYQKCTENDYAGQIDATPAKYTSLMPEYSQCNYGDFRAAALLIEDGDGAPVIDLRYSGYAFLPQKPCIASGIPVSRGGETLAVTLTDAYLNIDVVLYYTVYEDCGILTRRAEIRNRGKKTIRLKRALSISLDFPDANFELLTLVGNHACERQVQKTPLMIGFAGVGNSRGMSSHHHSPFAALMRPDCREESGEIYGCSLMYSGSHLEQAEVDHGNRTRLLCGIHPLNFTWVLDPGASFETPEAVLCYSSCGMGAMSRSYHDFFRRYVLSPRFVGRSRPIVFNSWEGMHFGFHQESLTRAIESLRGSGIELFVLDDGWFGQRNCTSSGLGDWTVNREKLPGGLRAVADCCRENGMQFGLWIEPEMVNPDSSLFRAHPDWIIRAPGRAPVLSRNQCVLDITRREVLDFIKSEMHRVISESSASYIKWDANRHLTENWSAGLPPEHQGEVQHRYILAVYELAEYLTSSFPDILFEGCSGGGGRFDGAMLHYFPQIWVSDDTDAHERTGIQYGTGLCFPLCTQSCHVSGVPNIRNGRVIPLRTRAAVASLGIFGYEFDCSALPPVERARIPEDIAAYRRIEDLVLNGDLYRMKNTAESNEFLVALVSKDRSRAYAVYYQALNPHKNAPQIRINGLDDRLLYLVEELNLTLYGDVLRLVGIQLPRMRQDFDVCTLHIKAVTDGAAEGGRRSEHENHVP